MVLLKFSVLGRWVSNGTREPIFQFSKRRNARDGSRQARPHRERGQRRRAGRARGGRCRLRGAHLWRARRRPGHHARARGRGQTSGVELHGVASDHAGGWYDTTGASGLHVSSAGRVRTVATCEDCRGIFVSWDGSAKFVADAGNATIRRVEVATGAVTTLAGSGEEGDEDGVGGAAQFKHPHGVTISPDGCALLWRTASTTRSGGWRWRWAR